MQFSSGFLRTKILFIFTVFIKHKNISVLIKVFYVPRWFLRPFWKEYEHRAVCSVSWGASRCCQAKTKKILPSSDERRRCKVRGQGGVNYCFKIPTSLMLRKLKLAAISCFVGRLHAQQGCPSHREQFSWSDKPSESGWVTHQRHWNWSIASQRTLHLIRFYLFIKS